MVTSGVSFLRPVSEPSKYTGAYYENSLLVVCETATAALGCMKPRMSHASHVSCCSYLIVQTNLQPPPHKSHCNLSVHAFVMVTELFAPVSSCLSSPIPAKLAHGRR
jgi:hypothetical protein